MIPKKCIIHAGMHKTGTTSIQETLFRNASLQGAAYIDVGVPNGTEALQAALLPDPENHGIFRRKALSREEVEPLVKASRQALVKGLRLPDERVIISAEWLSIMKNQAVLQRLNNMVLRQQREPEVVIYLRDARGYLESIFQQDAKTGLTELTLKRIWPDYKRRLEIFDTVFGREAVQLWKFQPAHFPDKCVVRDFCNKLELNIDPASIVRSNEALSRNAVILLMHYWRFVDNKPGYTTTPQARALVRVVRDLPGVKCKLAPELLAPLFAENRADLDWVHQRAGHRIDGLGVPSDIDIRGPEDLVQLDWQGQAWLEERLETPLGSTLLQDAELGRAAIQLAEKEAQRIATHRSRKATAKS